MIPMRRPQGVKPTPVTPLPGLTKGMARLSWSKGERSDIAPKQRMHQVGGYPPGIGPAGVGIGIAQTPQAPQAGGSGDARERLLAYVKSGRKRDKGSRVTSYDQLLQAAQGGGRPQGPGVSGYVNQLMKTLLEGM